VSTEAPVSKDWLAAIPVTRAKAPCRVSAADGAASLREPLPARLDALAYVSVPMAVAGASGLAIVVLRVDPQVLIARRWSRMSTWSRDT
jgi:hypothetical protein